MQNLGTSLSCPPSGRGFRIYAAGLIGLCGAYQVGLGTYFIALRPPLLPEDLRYFGAGGETLRAILPRLEPWLHLVFTVLGGQMAAVGLLVIAVALRIGRREASFRRDLVLLGMAGALSVGLMAAVNFALGSDVRWLLILPTGLWVLGLGLAAHRPRGATRNSSTEENHVR